MIMFGFNHQLLGWSYFCQTRQVHQGQIQHMGRVNFEVNGLACDALVIAGNTGGLVLDLAFDIAKVGEASVGNVVELCPLAGSRNVGVPLRGMCRGGGLGLLVGNVDKLKNQRSTSDNATATRQKISTDDVLEDRGFASRLGAYNDLYVRRGEVVSAVSSSRKGAVEKIAAGVQSEASRASRCQWC